MVVLLLLSQWTGAVNLTSSDPNWIGTATSFGTTEGNDYWMTFMNNNMFDPSNPVNEGVLFELKIAVSAREDVSVNVEIDGAVVQTLSVGANQTVIYDLNKSLYNKIYLWQSETIGYKGVHVYATDRSKYFSCYSYSRNGEAGGSSRDASLVIPTDLLGKEYFIQTSPNDAYSTEFSIVATEDNTEVVITPSFTTFGNKSGAFTITLNKGDAYLVASKQHVGDDFNVDLSGSRLCSNKPIAVFNGNQQTSFPVDESYTMDFAMEQSLPITQWGSDFYLSYLANTVENNYRITAGYDGTTVSIRTYDKDADTNTDETVTLNAGESIDPSVLDKDIYTEAVIHTSKPVIFYDYTTSAAINQKIVGTGADRIRVNVGDPANAMLPAWQHKVKAMNFYTHDLDPQLLSGKKPPQYFYVYVVTKTADTGKIKIDGANVSGFKAFKGEPTMSYAHIEITNPTSHYHSIETEGEGFVGMVYGLTHAQGWFYTLGFSQVTNYDSLFVENTEAVMSQKSYDLPRLPNGWYQRLLNEWKAGYERLDTAQVCDSTIVQWKVQTPKSKQVTQVDWAIYDVTDGSEPSNTNKIKSWTDNTPAAQTSTDNLYKKEYQFILPDESALEPSNRSPFKEYEVHAVLHRPHLICTELAPDLDTMRTTVRVTRIYHDTIYRVICMGDTLKCFYDSLPHQGGMELVDEPNKRDHTKASQTMFIGDKTPGNTTQKWEWKAKDGQNIFTRKYETIYGCDSTYTLYLFVCDTFRFVDHTNLVSNGAYEYHDERYVGHEYHEQHPDDIQPDDHVIPEGTFDTIVFVKYKTQICGCQLNSKYPTFEGCDSIYELHIKYHETFFQSDTFKICDNEREVYNWNLRPDRSITFRGNKWSGTTAATDTVLTKYKTTIIDSLNTKTLPERDSVYELIVYMNPTYKYYDTLHVCDNKSVTWDVDDTPARTYNGADYTTTWEHEDTWSGQTVKEGCDSIRYLKIWVHRTFFQQEDSVFCQDINNTKFVWKDHENRKLYDKKNNTWIQASSLNLREAGEFIYVDSLLNPDCQQCEGHGCDSVYELHLTVNPSYGHLQITDHTMCQNETYTWRAHSYNNLPVGDFTFTDDSVTRHWGCDSTFTLHLHVDTAYVTPVEITKRHMCDKDTLHFYGQVFRGEKAVYLASDATTIPIPSDQTFATETTIQYTDHTKLGCDSVVQHRIYVYKTYEFSAEDHICQGVGYEWNEHTSGQLWDVQQKKWISANNIPTNLKSGEVYTYIDSLKTKNCNVRDKNGKCGCDSVWILKLRIDSVYRYTEDAIISDEQSYKWQHTIYIGNKVDKDTLSAGWFEPELTETGNKPEIVIIPEGDIHNEFTKPYTSVLLGCDSTYTLNLTVGPTFRDEITAYTCDNTPYKWHHDNDPDPNHYARTDIEILTPGTYIDPYQTSYGFDSIYILHLYNWPTYNKDTTDTIICQKEPFTWKRHEGHTLWDKQNGKRITTIPTNVSGTFYYIDSTYKTINGCDSVWTLKLFVPPSYEQTDTISLCAHDTISWERMLLVGSQFAAYGGSYDATKYDSVLIAPHGVHKRTIRWGTAIYDCDSIFKLELTVDTLYRDTIDVRQCQDTIDGKYEYKYLNNGAGGYLPAQWLYQSIDRNDTIRNKQSGCDSMIVTLHFHVDSVYHYHQDLGAVCQAKDSLWAWKNQFGDTLDYVSLSEGDKKISLTKTFKTIHQCDSIFTMDLYIPPTYHTPDTLTICENDSVSWQGIMFTGREFSAYNAGGYDPTPYSKTRDNLEAGIYYDTVRYTTDKYDCDSIFYLTLTIHPVKRDTIVERVCQSPGGTWFYKNLNNGAGGYLPAEHLSDSLKLLDTLQTSFGCDSIVGLIYYVDSVYHYHQDLPKVCQDTVNTKMEWIDEFGISHGFIDISRARDIDSIEFNKTIHECDSNYTFHLHVAPIYRFDSIYSICDNERISWQGKWYCGEKYEARSADDIILKAGCRATQDTIYCDTVRYVTVEDCDSTYLLQLHVYPTFDDTVRVHVCDNEDKHTYIFKDTQGNEFTHYVPFAPTPSVEFVTKPDIDTLFTYTLKTIHGCDSVVTVHLTIHPTYFFESEDKVCFGVERLWHGQVINASGIYYAPYTTVHNSCDSIYKLEFYVKPYLTVPIFDYVCDNHVYYHRDTIWSKDGEMAVIEDTVWHPGSAIPDPEKRPYIEVKYYGADGCDSIAFQYHLTVCKTYRFDAQTDALCSGDTFYSEAYDHAWSAWAIEYDVDTFVVPYDTLFIDSLLTVMGCDSVFNLQAHVYPAYRHIDYDTICSNEPYDWRKHHLTDMIPGLNIIRDSFPTVDGCDSIYELQLMVNAHFFNEKHIKLCADDSIDWHGLHIASLEPQPDEYLFWDSLLTQLNCDSVYHLYVLALDTTMEVNYDTICIGDTLHVLDHIYTIAGDYKDTTLNVDGCHHFIYTHLAVIPPTVPTIWADTMCSQDQAFELHYTYTSHDPLSFSLYYDSLGHEMGFEDMIDVPITEYTNPMVITIPIPLRDDDRTKYPRPDVYHFTLVLDNGFCQRPMEDCVNDSTFIMSYPAWLIEQHYMDVIALLSEKYNGGYTWTDYQWYKGDSILVGQTKPYLHIPTGLELGASYYVRLKRPNEEQDFQTCPITIGAPKVDPYAPTMGYLSVSPTCVPTGHPFVNILSHSPEKEATGAYRVSATDGNLIQEGYFHADVTQVELPAIEGMYIFQLWSNDTPEEPYRAIKVIVKQQCPTCDISSF